MSFAYYINEVNKISQDILDYDFFSENDTSVLIDHIVNTIYMYDTRLPIDELTYVIRFIIEIKSNDTYTNKDTDDESLDDNDNNENSDESSMMSLDINDLDNISSDEPIGATYTNSELVSDHTDKIQLSSYKDLISHRHDYKYDTYKESIYIKRKKRISDIEKIPQFEQGTKEWLGQRKGCITATGVAIVLDEDPNQFPIEFFMDKCGRGMPFIENKYVHHGKKYEEIGNMFYSFRNNVIVGEYGLLPHAKHRIIGASPDGICKHYRLDCKKLSSLVGRLLEIKFPYIREILSTGELDGDICPHYYFVQVQTQLFVTEMDECDFLQCKIEEYQSFQDYVEDSVPNLPGLSKRTNLEKGCIVQLYPRNLVSCEDKDQCLFQSKYIYQPKLHMTSSEIEKWIADIMLNFHSNELSINYIIDRVIYWRLSKVSCSLIKYDKEWFESKIPMLKQFWSYVEFYRQNPNLLNKLIKYVDDIGINKSADLFAKIHKEYSQVNITKYKPLYQTASKWRDSYNTKYAYKYRKMNMRPKFKLE